MGLEFKNLYSTLDMKFLVVLSLAVAGCLCAPEADAEPAVLDGASRVITAPTPPSSLTSPTPPTPWPMLAMPPIPWPTMVSPSWLLQLLLLRRPWLPRGRRGRLTHRSS